MSLPAPNADEQIRFLDGLQRILSEGSFVASYKFALLHALADLAVIKGSDSGDELVLSTREIAEEMIELYWRQAALFPVPGGRPVVLKQNTGAQAAILRRLHEARQEHGGSVARVRRSAAWQPLSRQVEYVLKVMPLWRLQTVGSERLEFLYERPNAGNVRDITLKPGVAYCLRAFYPLVLDLVRGAWLRFVRAANPAVLGEATDLSAFLFGVERASLALYTPVLQEVQQGCCFYCKRTLVQAVEVDHFIPWSRYPVDLGHNFVLAHAACNRAKSDHLAAEAHLERWLQRNEEHGQVLAAEFDRQELLHDLATSTHVTHWSYSQSARLGAQVWVARDMFAPLGPDWRRLFRVLTMGPE